MGKPLLGIVLFVVYILFVAIAAITEQDENAAIRFLGYLAVFVITILEFLIILNQYFGIKLSDLIL